MRILVVRLFCYGAGDDYDDCSISGLVMVTTWSEHSNETPDQALKILKDLKTKVIRDEWSLREFLRITLISDIGGGIGDVLRNL